MINIKILGPGCANCKRLEEVIKKTCSEMGFEPNIIKVKDYAKRETIVHEHTANIEAEATAAG
jgi:hypothetical protein